MCISRDVLVRVERSIPTVSVLLCALILVAIPMPILFYLSRFHCSCFELQYIRTVLNNILMLSSILANCKGADAGLIIVRAHECVSLALFSSGLDAHLNDIVWPSRLLLTFHLLEYTNSTQYIHVLHVLLYNYCIVNFTVQ